LPPLPPKVWKSADFVTAWNELIFGINFLVIVAQNRYESRY
jgi:hypothetical protein